MQFDKMKTEEKYGNRTDPWTWLSRVLGRIAQRHQIVLTARDTKLTAQFILPWTMPGVMAMTVSKSAFSS